MKNDLSWRQKLVVIIMMIAVVLWATKWATEPEQYHAGDPNYDELVAKDKAHQLYKVEKQNKKTEGISK